MSWSRLDLGVGLVALAGTDLLWDGIADLVDVVEVEPQTIWRSLPGSGWALDDSAFEWLDQVDRAKLSHGVGFPVGGTVAPDLVGIRHAAASARRLGAVHWSEHLSFNRAARGNMTFNAGFLLPPVPLPSTVRTAVENIARYQDSLDLPFLIETPASYLRAGSSDMTDGELVAAASEGADCGILLDLHNIWANERNGRQSVADFLAEIPLERVWEVHLAGGFELDGYYLDAHCGPVPMALLELAEQVVPSLPNVRAVLFESVPASLMSLGVEGVRDVMQALQRIAALGPMPHEGPSAPRRSALADTGCDDSGAAADRELKLAAYVTRSSGLAPQDDPGADILRHLTDHARLSLVTAAEPVRLRWMLEHLGRQATDELLASYLSSCPASGWASDEGTEFAHWFDRHHQTYASGTRVL